MTGISSVHATKLADGTTLSTIVKRKTIWQVFSCGCDGVIKRLIVTHQEDLQQTANYCIQYSLRTDAPFSYFAVRIRYDTAL